MKTIVRMIEDELYDAENENGNHLSIDMRPPEIKQSLSPPEMLLSGLCACIAVDVVSILKKKRKTVNDLVTEANGIRRREHPRGFTYIMTKLTLTSPDTTEEELLKVSQLAMDNYCTVASTLNSELELSAEIIKP